MSPQCRQADVLLHTDVAIGTTETLAALHRSSTTSFYFSWARSVARVLVSMATLQSDATKPSQNPPWVPWQDTNPGSAIGWHADCRLQLATMPAELTQYTTPTSFRNHLLTGYSAAQHSAQFHAINDSAIYYYSWWIYRNVSDRMSSDACVKHATVFFLCVCSRVRGQQRLWGKHGLQNSKKPLNY